MKVLFSLITSAMAISLYMPSEASWGLPANIETIDRLWQRYNASCKQGDQKAYQLRDNYQEIVKQNFPHAVSPSCPQSIKRVWFETGRKGMAAGCQMFWSLTSVKVNHQNCLMKAVKRGIHWSPAAAHTNDETLLVIHSPKSHVKISYTHNSGTYTNL